MYAFQFSSRLNVTSISEYVSLDPGSLVIRGGNGISVDPIDIEGRMTAVDRDDTVGHRAILNENALPLKRLERFIAMCYSLW
jgi:hypothetical protein